MKKYYQSATKIFAGLTAVCILMIVIAMLLISLTQDQFNLVLLFLGIGIPFEIIFLSAFLGCVLSYLQTDHEKIIFSVTRAPKLCLKRNAILYSEIKFIKPTFYKGDGLISRDTTMYHFVLNNGHEFTETFYQYGKKQEQEIVSLLRSHIKFS